MKIYNENGDYICTARACRKPKFSLHRGRTWDCIEKRINGDKYDFIFDSTWGANMYFEYNDRWYSIQVILDDRTDLLSDHHCFKTVK